MRKYTVWALALALLLLLLLSLAACGNTGTAEETPSPEETPAAAETEPPEETAAAGEESEPEAPDFAVGFANYAPDTIVATADGRNIDWETYYGALYRQIYTVYAYYGITDLTLDFGEGATLGEVLREGAETNLLQSAMLFRRAEALDLALTEEDKAEIDAEIDDYAAKYAGGDLNELFETIGITEAYYRMQAGASILYDKLFDYYFGEKGENLPDGDALAWLEDNNYLYAKHILFMTVDSATREPLDEAAAAQKKALAEEVYAALAAADPSVLPELFDTMMQTYSEDTGLAAYPDGYFFQEGTMVDEFYQAALGLEEGQLSEIVESAYGYHILYRPALNPDAVFGVDASYEPYTLRYQVAQNLLENLLNEWFESAEFLYAPAFENLDVAALFAENETEKELRAAVEAVVGEENLAIFNYSPASGSTLIQFKGSENLTNDLTIQGMYLDMFHLLKTLQPMIDTDVEFQIVYPLVDVYGNTNETVVIQAVFAKDTIQRINFSNALSANIPLMADEWWEHAAVGQNS